MSATGLDPMDEGEAAYRAIFGETVIEREIRKSKERLAEFDRLMAQGGIEAVVEALRKE